MFYCGRKLKSGGNCKRKVKKNGNKCNLHSSGRKSVKMETHGTIYSSSDKLSKFYSKNLVKDSFLHKGILELYDIKKQIEDFCSDLEGEIIVGRALLRVSLNELDKFSDRKFKKEEDKRWAEGRKVWMRSQIFGYLKELGSLVEKNHKVKYGEQFTIRIENVQRIFLTFNEILMRNITDPNLLKKIIIDMEKTIALEEKK